MDFHRLIRKDLQSLCKLNKIPANRTNVAMAEALSSLKTVKGIEKYCKSSESSVVESSVESPEKNVVTSMKTTRGRRKQVREGSGVVQTVTPFTRRKNGVPVASVKTVQRVYNTRLSSRLLKKKSMESEKKECVEAVKISSYCDVVSDNDFGEVFEEKNISGSDNVGVELPVSEIEQEEWKVADKDLDSWEKAAANFESKVPENNGLQVDTIEAILEMASDDNMAVKENPLHNEKDDVGVDFCLSKTNILTEVLAHEGSFDVGGEFLIFKIEQEIESLTGGDAFKDLDSRDTAVTKMKQLLENNDDGGVNLCLCKTDFSAKVLAHEGSVYVGVESPVSEIEQECESPKGNGADEDLDLSDTALTNMNSKVLENNGLQVDTTLESVLEMLSDDNMVVIDKPLHNKNDEGVDLFLCKTDVSTEVLAHGVKVLQMNTDNSVVETPTNEKKSIYLQEEEYVDVGFSFPEKEFQSESRKGVYGESLDAQVTASTDLKVQVLNGKGFCNVGVDSPVSEIEVKSESPNLKSADKELDLRDPTATEMKPEVLENCGLQVNTVEDFFEMPSNDDMPVVDPALNNKDCLTWSDDVGVDLNLTKTDVSIEVLANDVEGFQVVPLKPLAEMPSHDNKAVGDMPHHKKKDDVVVDISLSEIEMTTEVLAHEVELLTVDTQKAVVEMPIHETMAVEQVFSPQKNGSDNVGVHFTFFEGSDNVGVQFSFLETDENVDAAVTRSTESESLKEQLKMESCEKVDYGELVQDLVIQPKSEKIVHKCWSSAANSFVDGENLDISLKIQEDISCKKESGFVYDNGKGLASQEEVSGKAIACDLSICSESYERTENSIHIGDYDSPDTDFFQQSVSSKQSDSKRKSSEILSCHNDEEFVDHSEMPGSVDESQQASEVKSPSFFKQSAQMCPSSVPPVLPSQKAKISGSEPPLILEDYPFTQRFMSSGVRSLEPTFNLKSNVSNDKENMEQSENKVEVTEKMPRRGKNEFPVCKKSDIGLNVRSPR